MAFHSCFYQKRRGDEGANESRRSHTRIPRPLCLMGDEGFKKLSPPLGSSASVRNLVPKSGRAPLHFFVLLLTSFGSAPLSLHPRFFSHPTQDGHGPTLLIDRSIHHSYSLLPPITINMPLPYFQWEYHVVPLKLKAL